MATTDEREYTPKPAQKWRYSTAANAALHDVMVQREEILAAFVAKYGFGPEEAIQVEQRRPDGTTTWRVERQAKPAPAPAAAANRPLWEMMDEAYNQAYGNYNKAYSVLLRTLEDCRHVSDRALDDYKQARDEFYQSHEALIKDFETNND